MKTLILTSLITLMTIAGAQAAVTAKIQFSINDGAEMTDGMSTIRLIDVELNDEKTITVKSTAYRGRFGRYFPVAGSPQTTTENLSNLAYKKLENMRSRVNQAEIVVTRRHIVCMMMPGFGMEHTSLTIVQKNGVEKKILGPQGCWLSTTVAPKHDYDVRTATAFKAMLETLALNTIN